MLLPVGLPALGGNRPGDGNRVDGAVGQRVHIDRRCVESTGYRHGIVRAKLRDAHGDARRRAVGTGNRAHEVRHRVVHIARNVDTAVSSANIRRLCNNFRAFAHGDAAFRVARQNAHHALHADAGRFARAEGDVRHDGIVVALHRHAVPDRPRCRGIARDARVFADVHRAFRIPHGDTHRAAKGIRSGGVVGDLDKLPNIGKTVLHSLQVQLVFHPLQERRDIHVHIDDPVHRHGMLAGVRLDVRRARRRDELRIVADMDIGAVREVVHVDCAGHRELRLWVVLMVELRVIVAAYGIGRGGGDKIAVVLRLQEFRAEVIDGLIDGLDFIPIMIAPRRVDALHGGAHGNNILEKPHHGGGHTRHAAADIVVEIEADGKGRRLPNVLRRFFKLRQLVHEVFFIVGESAIRCLYVFHGGLYGVEYPFVVGDDAVDAAPVVFTGGIHGNGRAGKNGVLIRRAVRHGDFRVVFDIRHQHRRVDFRRARVGGVQVHQRAHGRHVRALVHLCLGVEGHRAVFGGQRRRIAKGDLRRMGLVRHRDAGAHGRVFSQQGKRLFGFFLRLLQRGLLYCLHHRAGFVFVPLQESLRIVLLDIRVGAPLRVGRRRESHHRVVRGNVVAGRCVRRADADAVLAGERALHADLRRAVLIVDGDGGGRYGVGAGGDNRSEVGAVRRAGGEIHRALAAGEGRSLAHGDLRLVLRVADDHRRIDIRLARGGVHGGDDAHADHHVRGGGIHRNVALRVQLCPVRDIDGDVVGVGGIDHRRARETVNRRHIRLLLAGLGRVLSRIDIGTVDGCGSDGDVHRGRRGFRRNAAGQDIFAAWADGNVRRLGRRQHGVLADIDLCLRVPVAVYRRDPKGVLHLFDPPEAVLRELAGRPPLGADIRPTVRVVGAGVLVEGRGADVHVRPRDRAVHVRRRREEHNLAERIRAFGDP